MKVENEKKAYLHAFPLLKEANTGCTVNAFDRHLKSSSYEYSVSWLKCS